MEYPGACAEYQEALSNTMEFYRTAWSSKEYEGAPCIPSSWPEIPIRSLEYQEALTKNCCKFVSRFCKTKKSQDPPKWRPGANVCIFKRFWTDLGYHFGPIFGPKNYHMLQESAFEIDSQRWRKVMLTRPRPGANSIKWYQKGSPRSPKTHQKGTQLMPKRPKIHQNDVQGAN